MTRPDPEDLEAFIAGLGAATLSNVLIELARDVEAVRKRLDRLRPASQPKALATAFKATLTGWRRATRFIGYRDSHAFGGELEGWLGQIERELVPHDPAAALALAESFIESDAKFFERADDSDGAIGDAVREACRLWLRAAVLCKPPPQGWTARLFQLANADEYGARDELLRSANLLLDEEALRVLVDRFDQELIAGVNAADSGQLPPSVFSASGSLHLLSGALGDPDVHVRAVLRYSPQPNAMQRQGFARAYLNLGRAEDALPWLDGDWGHLESSRQRLQAEALDAMGRASDSADIRRQLFDETAAVGDFRAWIELLPPDSHVTAIEHAARRAHASADPVIAARLLLEVRDERGAELALIDHADTINGNNYGELVPLAEALEARELLRGATACYRALLLAILARAYARAYGHAAQYFKKLTEIALQQPDLQPLATHESFEAIVRTKHARKVAFWSYVNGKRALPDATASEDDIDAK